MAKGSRGTDGRSKSTWPIKRSQLPDNKNINENHEGRPFYSLLEGYVVFIDGDGPTASDDDDYVDWESWAPNSNDNLEALPICREIKLLRVCSDIKGKNYSRYVEFEDHRAGGKTVKVQIQEKDLLLHQRKVLVTLIENGLDITECPENPTTISKHICRYLIDTKPAITGIEKTSYWLGWCTTEDGIEDHHHDDEKNFNNRFYVLPEATYKFGVGRLSNEDRVRFRPTGKNDKHPSFKLSKHGGRNGLDEWKYNVSRYAPGNSRLLLVMSASFSAVLLEPLGINGVGFHLAGESSTGKTIAVTCALSIWGPPAKHCLKLDGSLPGFEQACSAFSSSYCAFDELGQLDDKSKLGSLIYKMTHGEPKLRMQTGNKNIYETSVRPWRLMVSTTGEVGVSKFMEESGQRQMSGQAVRLIEVPAEVVPGSLFETILDDFTGSKEFSEHLEANALTHYGWAGRKFLDELFKEYSVDQLREEFNKFYIAFYNKLKRKYKNEDTGGQFGRAARSFALLAFAGEHATRYGATGWPEFEAIKGAMKCFDDWKKLVLGNSKNAQDNKCLEKIILHLSEKKNTFLDCGDLDVRPPVDPDKIGYFKIYQKRPCLLMSEEYMLHQVFKGDVDGFRRGIKALKGSSMLIKPTGTKGIKLQHRNRLYQPNGQQKNTYRFYTVCTKELKKVSDKIIPC